MLHATGLCACARAAPAAPPPRAQAPHLEARAAAEAADARTELARRKLSHFVRQAFEKQIKTGSKLEWSWYLDAICEHVQAIFEDWLIANGKEPDSLPGLRARVIARWKRHGLALDQRRMLVQNLALNIAPGTLKSVIVMVCFPAWVWLHAPGFQWGCSSGSPGNVTRDSDAHRDLVRSPWYRDTFQVAWDVRPDIDAKELWATTAGGQRLSRGMVAKWTGVHVDGLLLDDPDGAYTVFNASARRDVQGKWTNEMENRVNETERSFRIIVQQHVHTEDLTSHLLALGAWSPETVTSRARWAKLEIAMEFIPSRRHVTFLGWTDPRKDAGQVMHPERFSPEFLASKREKLGSYGYEAQYNQNPEILEGGWFQRGWFRFFRMEAGGLEPQIEVSRPRPALCRSRDPKADDFDPAYVLTRTKQGALALEWMVISVDATFGSKKASASNVGLLAVGGAGNRRFVFDDQTKARSFLETKTAVKELIGIWRPSRVLIEKKANGAAVLEELEQAIAEGDICDAAGNRVVCVLEEIEPAQDGGGKESRASAAMPTIEQGLVYLLDGAPWVDDFVGELCAFPNGRKDDRVDALTQVINRFRSVRSAVERWRVLSTL